jgi:hypothetical protein
MKDPSRRLIDKPKLAAALAVLKKGLREDADPLYDTWKHPRPRRNEGPAADASPASLPQEALAAPEQAAAAPEAAVAAPEQVAAVPEAELVAPAAPPTASDEKPVAPAEAPVYQVFPRWAVVTVAVALAFALGAIVVFALRPRSERERPTRLGSGEAVEVLVQAATVDRPPDMPPDEPRAAPAASISVAVGVAPSAAPPRKKSDSKSNGPAKDLFRTPGF